MCICVCLAQGKGRELCTCVGEQATLTAFVAPCVTPLLSPFCVDTHLLSHNHTNNKHKTGLPPNAPHRCWCDGGWQPAAVGSSKSGGGDSDRAAGGGFVSDSV